MYAARIFTTMNRSMINVVAFWVLMLAKGFPVTPVCRSFRGSRGLVASVKTGAEARPGGQRWQGRGTMALRQQRPLEVPTG